jgi:hypothetical protein
MTEAFVERRRTPRVAVSGRARLAGPLTLSVRVVDVGLSGVLLSASQPLAVGQYARLCTRLGEIAVEADIEVRRVGTRRDDKDKNGYNLGARFVSLDEATRRAMQQFLSAANR